MKKLICLLVFCICVMGCSNERATSVLIPKDIHIALPEATKVQAMVAVIIPEEVGNYSYTDDYVSFHQKKCYYKIGPALKKNLISVLQNHFKNVQIFDSSLIQIPDTITVIFVPSIEEFTPSRFTGTFSKSEVRMVLRLEAFSRSQETLWSEDFYGESSVTIGWDLEKRIQELTQVTQQQIFDSMSKSLSNPEIIHKLISEK